MQGELTANMFVGFSSEQEHNFHPCSAQGSNSDCYLKPVRIFPDPFRCDPHILVLCEVLDSDKNPAATNHRFSCNKTMTKGTGFTHPFYCVQSIRSSEIVRSFDYKYPVCFVKPKKSSPKSPGLEWNKNGQCSTRMVIHTDGQNRATPDHKDHTIALLDTITSTEEMLSRLIIELVFMLVSKSLEQMPKLCHPNGNFKLDHAKASKWAISFGWQGKFFMNYFNPKKFPKHFADFF